MKDYNFETSCVNLKEIKDDTPSDCCYGFNHCKNKKCDFKNKECCKCYRKTIRKISQRN